MGYLLSYARSLWHKSGFQASMIYQVLAPLRHEVSAECKKLPIESLEFRAGSLCHERAGASNSSDPTWRSGVENSGSRQYSQHHQDQETAWTQTQHNWVQLSHWSRFLEILCSDWWNLIIHITCILLYLVLLSVINFLFFYEMIFNKKFLNLISTCHFFII